MSVNLPAAWVKCPTSEVATLIRGVSYAKADARKSEEDGFMPILRANNINGTINLDDLVFVRSDLISQQQRLRAGDILFAMSSGSRNLVGKSARISKDFEAGFGAFCGVLRPDTGISNEYLALIYQTQEFRHAISEAAKGSNINNLKREHLLDYEIPLPPLNEQKRIVAKIEELFSELDAGEESLRRARHQLGIYRQSLLKQAFEGKLTAHWRTQNPDHAAAWKEVEVADVLTAKPNNGRSVKDRKGGFKVLRLTAIKDGIIDLAEHKEGDWSESEAKPWVVKSGDFLASRGNGSIKLVGRGGIVRESADVAFPDTMIRLPLDLNLVSPKYFSHLWNSDRVRHQIEGSARTTAGIYKINQGMLVQYRIPLCSLPEQQEIVRLLDEQFEAISRNEQEIDAALKRSEALRQSILKRAFTGHLVPQDPADEPATTLLARIQAEREAASTKAPRKQAARKRAARHDG